MVVAKDLAKEKRMSQFVSEIEAIAPQHKKLAEALLKKIDSYGHWPEKKSHGMKLAQFTESKEIVFLLADILKNNKDYPEFQLNDTSRKSNNLSSYCTFIHIFLQYILEQKEGCAEIAAALGRIVEQACDTVMKDEKYDNRYYMLMVIFKSYKADKDPLLKELHGKLSVVPKDKLRFDFWSYFDYYSVKAYTEFTGGAIKIPAEYNGKPVKKIASDGFAGCKSLAFIEMPEGIEIIDDGAFDECSKIKEICLPQSLKEIGKAAFSACSMKEVIIPPNVEKIGERAFQFIDENFTIKVVGRSEKPEGWHDNWNQYYRDKFCDVIWEYEV